MIERAGSPGVATDYDPSVVDEIFPSYTLESKT